MRSVTVHIGGEDHTIDLDNILHIHNADAERHTVAADVAWWGILAAAAASEQERLTAACASWFSQALVKLLGEDEKMSEWKAKAYVQAHPEWLAYQEAIADAHAVAEKANSLHWTLIRKSDMLRAMLPGENGERRTANDIGYRPHDLPTTPTQREQRGDSRLNRFKESRQAHKED